MSEDNSGANKSKTLPKNISKEKLISLFYLCPWLLNLVFFLRTLFKLRSQHQHLFLTMCSCAKQFKMKFCKSPVSHYYSFHSILPCALAAHEHNYLLTVAVTDPLITTKAFTLYISFPVATGNTQESEAGKYWKYQRMGKKTSHKTADHINLLSLKGRMLIENKYLQGNIKNQN